jgi:hypothetical protein
VLAAASTDSFDQAFAAANASTTKPPIYLVRRSVIAAEFVSELRIYTRITFILTVARVLTKTGARKSDTFASRRFSHLKRRSVIDVGGSVSADVGREACGPA